MKTQTDTVYLYLVARPDMEPRYRTSDIDMDSVDGYTRVDEMEITWPLPDNTNAIAVASLEKTKEKMKATAQAAITEVDNQIQSLLALENDSEA